DRDRVESSSHFIWNSFRPPQHDRQRTRPELDREIAGGAGDVDDERRDVVDACDVDDQRIVRWSLLGGEHALHRASIERVRAESIDRLGWKGDKAARAQALRRPGDQFPVGSRWIDSKYLGHQLGYSPIDAVGVALWTIRHLNTHCTRRTYCTC